jgi:hypothetical protein
MTPDPAAEAIAFYQPLSRPVNQAEEAFHSISGISDFGSGRFPLDQDQGAEFDRRRSVQPRDAIAGLDVPGNLEIEPSGRGIGSDAQIGVQKVGQTGEETLGEAIASPRPINTPESQVVFFDTCYRPVLLKLIFPQGVACE